MHTAIMKLTSTKAQLLIAMHMAVVTLCVSYSNGDKK